MKHLITLFLISFSSICIGQGTITADFTIGDIPTNYNVFGPGCNGANTKIDITLPSGGIYVVTGIDIQYNMTAQNNAWMSDQRSRLLCENNNNVEPTYSGVGNTAGIYSYSRSNVDIANGSYAGGTTLTLQMQAWRTFGTSPTCGTDFNKVDNNTWTISLYYTTDTGNGSVGIGTTTPESSAILDVSSTSKGLLIPRVSNAQMNSIPAPANGLMVFDTDSNSFKYFNGTDWVSFANETDTSDKIQDADGTTGVYTAIPNEEILFRTNNFYNGKLDNGRLYLGRDATNYPFATGSRLVLDGNNDDVDLVINDFDSAAPKYSTILLGATGTSDYNDNAMGIRYSGVDNEIQFLDRGLVWNSSTFQLEPGWKAPRMTISKLGNVSIGLTSVTDGSYKLSVDGNVISEELMIKNSTDWPDYVFEADYKLLELEAVEKFIKEHGHLPNIPSAEEIEAQGILSGEMHKMQMEKIEELTLYILALKKEIDLLKVNLNLIKND